jgi:hypothetical protein
VPAASPGAHLARLPGRAGKIRAVKTPRVEHEARRTTAIQ